LIKKIIVFSLIILSLTFASCSDSDTSLNTGKMENKNYINNWMDIKIEQPDGWEIIPDEELIELYSNQDNVVVGLGDSKKKQFENGSFSGLYPMGFVHTATNANLLIVIEKSEADPNEAINSYINNLRTQIQKLESQGLYYTLQDSKDATIGGFSCTQIEALAEYSGNKITQNYYLKPKDGYIFALITTSPSDDGSAAINELLDNIKTVQ